VTFLLSKNTNNQCLTAALETKRAAIGARLTELLPESDKIPSLHDTGGDSKAFSSEALKIFMRGMGISLAKLTTIAVVGMIANVKAELLLRERFDFDDGAILEMVIWRVPEPVVGCQHAYKYRLFYGRAGKRWVSYDNERPKGDHRHVGKREETYVFTDVETLMRDFLADVERWRSR
jgi:hypothetical protein